MAFVGGLGDMRQQCGHGKVSVEDGAHAGCIVRFGVPMTVAMKITAILGVTLCSLVDIH